LLNLLDRFEVHWPLVHPRSSLPIDRDRGGG
jgi:hypothetical protein